MNALWELARPAAQHYIRHASAQCIPIDVNPVVAIAVAQDYGFWSEKSVPIMPDRPFLTIVKHYQTERLNRVHPTTYSIIACGYTHGALSANGRPITLDALKAINDQRRMDLGKLNAMLSSLLLGGKAATLAGPSLKIQYAVGLGPKVEPYDPLDPIIPRDAWDSSARSNGQARPRDSRRGGIASHMCEHDLHRGFFRGERRAGEAGVNRCARYAATVGGGR